MEALSVLFRLLQYAGVSLAGGGALFGLYGPGPRLLPGLVRTGAGLGVVGAGGWLVTQAATFVTPPQSLDMAQVWTVAAETGFGRAALLRIGLLAAAFLISCRARGAPAALLGLAAAASFAWSGHGAADDGLRGLVHRGADIVHLVAAPTWVGALAALLALLPERPSRVARGLAAFSRIGLWVVAVLVASGLANSWFLVGPDGLGRLLDTAWGRLMGLKLMLFAGMLLLAAHHRYRLGPDLLRTQDVPSPAQERTVRISLTAEALLAFGVLMLVAWIGGLEPPTHAGG